MIRPIIGWGLGMCFLGLLNVTVFGSAGPQAPALLFGIGGFMVLLGLVLAITGLGKNVAAPIQALPDVSPPTTVLAVGLVLIALGAVVGLWLVWIGGLVTLVGIGGLVREARAQRLALQRNGETSP